MNCPHTNDSCDELFLNKSMILAMNCSCTNDPCKELFMYKWSLQWIVLVQMILAINCPRTNDPCNELSSYESSSQWIVLVQMILAITASSKYRTSTGRATSLTSCCQLIPGTWFVSAVQRSMPLFSRTALEQLNTQGGVGGSPGQLQESVKSQVRALRAGRPPPHWNQAYEPGQRAAYCPPAAVRAECPALHEAEWETWAKARRVPSNAREWVEQADLHRRVSRRQNGYSARV